MKTEIFFDNVRFLCKRKQIPIGQLEKDCGISTGYLSRNPESIPLKIAYSISERINVNLDNLCKISLEKAYKIDRINAQIKELQDQKFRLINDK